MGKFDFNFDGELTRKLEQLSNFDEIAEQMLTEAAPILARRVKVSIAKGVNRETATGNLLTSIRTKKKPEKNRYGWYTAVFPTGKSDDGKITNAQKLVQLEYGTRYMKPRGLVTKAVNEARELVNEKMMEVMERYTK